MVCVRVRPFNKREIEGDFKLCIRMPTTRHINISDENEQVKEFEFDRAYWSHSPSIPESGFCTQATLYNELGVRMIENAMTGINNCLFAYGQTGAGKTHTVLGLIRDEEFRGLLPRIVEGLFARFGEIKDEGGTVICEVSFLEIYNEKLKDLFSDEPPDKQPILSVKESAALGVHVPGLIRKTVMDYGQVIDMIEVGVSRREVGKTGMNATSSRSHCIFTFHMHVEQVNKATKAKKTFKSQTHLVDLAGSEHARRNKANELERVAINKSLTVLARVIYALAAISEGKKRPDPAVSR